MKTCVSSYSYRDVLNSGEMNQIELMSFVKEVGFDGIEFTDLSPVNGMTELEFAYRLREESEKIGLPIVNHTIGADFINCDSFDEQIEKLFKKVDIAEALGASGMRHDATGGFRDERKSYCTFDDALPILAKGCRMVTEYAAQKGVKTMIENHGFFCQDSTRVEKLVHEVAHPNFGLLVDIGNFLCADDPSVLAVGRVAAFAKHVHIKDFHVKDGSGDNPGKGFFKSRGGNYLRGAIVGHGNVPVRQCISILKANGYDGYLSIEFEGMEEPKNGIATGLENLKRYIELA